MRLVVLTFAMCSVLTACATEPGEVGGLSSHYFKNPPPERDVLRPPPAPADTTTETAEAQPRPPRWSSHYFRRQATPEPEQAAGERQAEAPKPAPEPERAAVAPPPTPKPAQQDATAQAPAAETAQQEAALEAPEAQTGFGSRHFRKPLTREELAVKLEARVLMLVMQERRRIDPNAKALAIDLELSDVARRHSEDMASKDYVGHTSDDGQTTATMIMDQDAKFRGVLGENIASQDYDGSVRLDVDEFAEHLVESWLNSADHKANLAYAPYERTGVGVAVNSHTIYVTQLFASDLGLPEPDLAPPPGAVKEPTAAKSGNSGGGQ